MIRNIVLFIIFTFLGTTQMVAQQDKTISNAETQQKNVADTLLVNASSIVSDSANIAINEQSLNPCTSPQDALNIPTLTEHGTMPTYGWPMFFCGSMLNDWNLHKGLNASLGASVFSTFGSGNTWSGAGFAENVSLMYAIPLNKRWSLAVGGFFSNASWAHDNYQTAGLSGILTYQINDKWSAYLYGQKSIVKSDYIPYPLLDMADLGDRIGIGVKYQVTPGFSLQLNVDERFGDSYSIPVQTKVKIPSGSLGKGQDYVPKAIDNSKGNF